MNNIKNKFFNNSFTAYLRALGASPIGSKRETSFMVEMFVNIFAVTALFFIVESFETFILADNIVIFGMSALPGTLLGAIWLILGVTTRAKPSPLGLLPISWKRRVVYDYLGNLVFTVFAVVVFAVAVLVWMTVLSVVLLAATGEWIFEISEGPADIVVTASAEGQLFSLFAGLFIYGAGATITNLQDKKLRIGLTVALPFVVELLGLLILNCANGSDFAMSGHIAYHFNDLPLSWLWLTATAIVAAGMVALSVFVCIKAEKPNEV
ncbi:MAG: hypothetical protein K2K80_07585 [Clostridia bacterium]|nr:hypothetical protein [Clostridia bacterium]